MPRVRPIAAAELPADLAQIYETYCASYGPFQDQAAILAHVPEAVRYLFPLLMDCKAAARLEARHLELAIVAVSKLNECHYCVAQHTPKLQVQGLSPQGVERVLDWRDHPELGPLDKLVVDYAIRVTTAPGRIPDALFADLRRHLTEAQIVELTLRVALTGFFNKFSEALQIDQPSGAAEAAD
jgi:uncharacterized peroxidase-related enzyme